MKLVISAGEVSGDQRGAEVLQALRRISSEPVEAVGFGGENLELAGMKVTHHLKNYAVMGFVEILFSLKKILKLEKAMKTLCLKEKPDCLLLVDYPGFNLRLGRWAKKQGIMVVQYVAPQMWAWGAWRTGKLKRSVDLLLTLFEFEESFFREHGIETIFTGHPLAEIEIEGKNTDHSFQSIALLPGSRSHEVELLLPVMLQAFLSLKEKGLVKKAKLAVSSNLSEDIYSEAIKMKDIDLINSTREALTSSDAALVCSGTATLETALYEVPFVICYKTSPITYFIAKHLVKGVKNIGLASIVAGRRVAPELIQKDVTSQNIVSEITPLLLDRNKIKEAKENFELVRKALGSGDHADNAAREIIRVCNEG